MPDNPSKSAVLTIATTHTQARYVLVLAIMSFRRKYPRVRLNVLQLEAEQVAKLLASGGADIGIANGILGLNPSLTTWEIYRWNHIAVVPHGHSLTKEASLTLNQLCVHPLVLTERGIAGRDAIDKAFESARLPMDVPLVARDSDIIKTYVEAGLGIGLIPSICYEVTKDYNLVTLGAGHLFGEHSAFLGVKKGSYVRLHASEFIKFLLPNFHPDYLNAASA